LTCHGCDASALQSEKGGRTTLPQLRIPRTGIPTKTSLDLSAAGRTPTKDRAVAVIEHPPGAETQWDWVDLPDPLQHWGWGKNTHLLVGALAHSGRWRELLDRGVYQDIPRSDHLAKLGPEQEGRRRDCHQSCAHHATQRPHRDGITDLIVRDAAGKLWLCPGDGTGGFGARTLMASGLNGMTAIITPGDVTGDGNADVLARARNGVLWLYQGTGASGVYPRRAIGSGWDAMDAKLWLYPGDGTGGVAARTPISGGWPPVTALATPGNLDGAGGNDLLTRDAEGRLWLHPGDNSGGFGAPRQIPGEWKDMTYIG
jgi:FG-GAP-like repeat